MTEHDLLQYLKDHPSLSFPFVCKEGGTYLETLSEIYEEYKVLTRKLLPGEDANAIAEECEEIKKIFRLHLEGKEDTFRKLEDMWMSIPSSVCLDSLEENLETIGDHYLYRARLSNTALENRKEAFHIPFDKRYLVGKFRYAIDGIPSLYLASSSYLCWVELNKPDMNEFWLSSMKAPELKVLDLAYDLLMITNDWDSDENALKVRGKLFLYPLIIASNMKRKYPYGKFQEEYIISSLFTKLCQNWATRCNGIRFFSTKLSNPRNESHVNYMLFTKPEEEDIQYSSFLKKHVTMTKPQKWTELQALNMHYEGGVVANKAFPPSDMEELIMDDYEQTSFYKAEQMLKKLQYDTIS